MIYLQILFCLLAIVSSVRLMPVDETMTTESTLEVTTSTEAAVTTSSSLESMTIEAVISSTTESGPESTTEEPFGSATDHEDPSIWSSSQTVEIRLHPQMLRIEEPKETLPVVARSESTTTSTTTEIPASIGETDIDGLKIFGQRMNSQQQQQHQDTSFSSIQTGRLRSKDSYGTALRRAVTGSPAVQKLQLSTSRMGSSRAKAGEITPRKIVGFGSLSNLPASRLPSNLPAHSLRKETYFKNRPTGHGGETPANTHIDPLSPHWLYGTSKDSRKPVDPFRLTSTGRLLVLGLREKMMSTTISTVEETTANSTSSDSAESTTTEATTTTASVVAEQIQSAEESKITTTTTTTTTSTSTTTSDKNAQSTSAPRLSGITPEVNYATPERNYGKAEANYATPEINYATAEMNHGTPETNHGITLATRHTETITTTAEVEASEASTGKPEASSSVSSSADSSTETNPFTSSKTKSEHHHIPLEVVQGETIKGLDKSPLDGQSSLKQDLGAPPVGDGCIGDDCDQNETGVDAGQLDNNEFDPDAHKYLVEEKTPDGYIIGEFGVISRSSGSLRGVRYTAHGSINPQLIQEALRTFLSL